VIYEHEERWWNSVDRGKLIHPPQLSGKFYQQSSSSKQEEREKEMNLALLSTFVQIFQVTFLYAVKSYDKGPPALLPLRRKVCCGFVSPLKISRLVWV
jgi:hypothetical protein